MDYSLLVGIQKKARHNTISVTISPPPVSAANRSTTFSDSNLDEMNAQQLTSIKTTTLSGEESAAALSESEEKSKSENSQTETEEKCKSENSQTEIEEKNETKNPSPFQKTKKLKGISGSQTKKKRIRVEKVTDGNVKSVPAVVVTTHDEVTDKDSLDRIEPRKRRETSRKRSRPRPKREKLKKELPAEKGKNVELTLEEESTSLIGVCGGHFVCGLLWWCREC
jgi:hypothetical protein